jgi:hypothetical protein
MKRCDTLFSKVIRARDKTCRNCGDRKYLQCAHLITRSYKAIRCDERNAVALCRSCHVYFTHKPLEWQMWCDENIGAGVMQHLRQRALFGGRNDWKAIEADLKQRLEGL